MDDIRNITTFPAIQKFIQVTVDAVISQVMKAPKFMDCTLQAHHQDCIDKIIQQTAQKLSAANNHFKFIVNCCVFAKGASIDMSSGVYGDVLTDGQVSIQWEGQASRCIVNVYGIAV